MSDVQWAFVLGIVAMGSVVILFERGEEWHSLYKNKKDAAKKEQEDLAWKVHKMDRRISDLANCIHNQAWYIGQLRRRIDALEKEED